MVNEKQSRSVSTIVIVLVNIYKAKHIPLYLYSLL